MRKGKDLVLKPEPKIKKVPSGPIREKNRTMNKLIAAVGKTLQKKGYPGLTIGNIAAEAGVDKKLIYLYFGNVDNLIEIFIKQRDFWNMAEKGVVENLLEDIDNIGRDSITTLLHSQFDKLYSDKLFQKLIHWELGEKEPTLKKIADKREAVGEKLFQVIEPDFKKSKVDLRASLALQIAGIYYIVLHAKTNGSTFCGIDINKPEGKKRISDAIAQMVGYIYDQAKVKK